MKKIYLLFFIFCFVSLNAQVISFNDANFKNKLLASNINNNIASNLAGNYFKIDTNNNGEIEITEAFQVRSINVSNSSITNITEILNFTNIVYLTLDNNQINNLILDNLLYLEQISCRNNQLTNLNLNNLPRLDLLFCENNNLSTLNLNGLTNLDRLHCNNNQLTNLEISGLTALWELRANFNQLSNINLNGLTSLKHISFDYNNLTQIDLSGLNQLLSIGCISNELTQLNVSNLFNLVNITCDENLITSLNVNHLVNLSYFTCKYNQLTTLNVSNLNNLGTLKCSNNLLNSLFIKNGKIESTLEFYSNPNLQYICADEGQIQMIENLVTQFGYSNSNVNSYCSFAPGGTFYIIQGNNKFDLNTNGCDILDSNFPNLKYNITNGVINGSIISNITGNYSIPVQTGTHTIYPVIENPSYFTVYPTTVNVTFPSQVSPFNQDFCITANGVHPDLEVTLLPINAARPGFDSTYKIIYKNKGNTTQSGTVNLTFNDAVLDFISAIPVTTSQSLNNLSWAFSNLQPFQTREIIFTLNVNSPMETPAVNGGDVLNYTATVTSPAIDVLPNDNTFAYNQTVVNSYDPNDKTCLQGNTIPPSKVGDYVHYMIRFENNGTANAQNVVIKDIIDTNKFEIDSLIPIKGSHDFVTNITTGNKVEFIFQNINLPFADATNDGYVSFKIKTKPTLVLGNTFSNSASIYFDFNFPIVTNTASTTIAALSIQDFEFKNYFSLYPNPVNDVLNITTKENIEVSSVSIYNTLGQLVLVIPNAQNTKTVDVSSLSSGNYFIKINSDKGTSNTKFIKQ